MGSGRSQVRMSGLKVSSFLLLLLSFEYYGGNEIPSMANQNVECVLIQI